MDPIRVTVSRGPVVEAVHRVHAVAVEDGRIVESAGDPELVTFYRSSSKPIQALPLARERDDVTEVELAIACASHRAAPEQVEAAASLLAKAPATEDDLECGLQEGREQRQLAHNCSGKHAGFLAVCRAREWPIEGLPLRRPPDAAIAPSGGRGRGGAEPRDEVPTAVDGCGVLTFALTLERMAYSFSRLATLDGGDRIAPRWPPTPG